MKTFPCVILILFMMIPINTQAFELPGDKFDNTEIILEVVWLSIHALDWGTTLNISSSEGRYYEMNPILGRHPNRESVHLYMLSGAILHPIFARILPKEITIFETKIPIRKGFQYISIGMSGICVLNNFNVGLHTAW